MIDGAMECAVDLSMQAEMSSKPFTCDCSMVHISSSVHRMSDGHSLFMSGVVMVTGGDDLLKQLVK